MEINQNYSKIRLWIVFVIFGIFALYILISYGKLSFTPLAENKKQSIKIERGSILDSSGKPLAVSASFYHVGVKPSVVEKYKANLAKVLASPLKMSEEEILSTIDNAPADFVYLKKRITETEYENAKYLLRLNNLSSFV